MRLKNKKMLISLTILNLVLLTACSPLKRSDEIKTEKYNYIYDEYFSNYNNSETIENNKQEENHLFRTTGVWINKDNTNEVIEMTDELKFALLPNVEDTSAFIVGEMSLLNGDKALEKLHISEDTIIEELSKEDYYSLIVDITKYSVQGYDLSKSINENSKIWYMLVFYSDNYFYLYDANNDTYKYFYKQQ